MSSELRVAGYGIRIPSCGFMMMWDMRCVICDKNFFRPHPIAQIPFASDFSFR
jgi:hypothetical protein